MLELDQNLAQRWYPDEWLEIAAWYRSFSLEVIRDQDAILPFASHPFIRKRIEAEFAATTLQRADLYEVLSYGDPSFLLTAPGPSLSGVLLQTLGTEEQYRYFYDYVITHLCRTFFAVTEPKKGSDAGHMETTLSPERLLNGEKMLFGNGAVAPIGTVLARTGSGPLDMIAILLAPELLNSGAVTSQVLEMFAMPGAQLSYMRFDALLIPEEMLLGRHLKAIERGMMGMLKTFHRFRPGVASMAIGHGQALVDYARQHFTVLREQLDIFDQRLAQVRTLNRAAAQQVDHDPLQGSLVSLAKSKATQIAEQIASVLSRQLPVSALLEHPWLSKSLADVYAYEYMEGTTQIQLQNIYNGYRRREIASCL